MKIVLCSAFRNAENHIGRYFWQALALKQALEARGDQLHLVIGDGDSVDSTPSLLRRYALPFSYAIVDCSHGGPSFGSVVNAWRFRQLKYVGNCMLDNVPDDADYVFILDGDLIWNAQTIVSLVDHLENYPAIAPMVMHRRPALYGDDVARFYDTWGFRRNGVRFRADTPYHDDLGINAMLVDSAGGCLAMRAEYARKARFGDDAILGLCRGIYAAGGSVWVDPAQAVWHE